MKRITSFAITFAILISGASSSAADASVRIEFIRGDDNSVLCDVEVEGSGGNVTNAVRQAAASCKVTYELKFWESFGAHTLEKFAGAGGWADCYWMFDVNNVPSWVGMDDKMLDDEDRVTWMLHNSSSCRHQGAYSTAGEGIVGLINPSTGGKVDLDGDGMADVDEHQNGTDYRVPDQSEAQVASAIRSVIYLDTDGDGASDLDERRAGTDPFAEDQTEESKIKLALKKAKSQIIKVINLLAAL